MKRQSGAQDRALQRKLREQTVTGANIVDEVVRLCAKELWIYDFRTNLHFTLKKNPLAPDDLQDFVRCYGAADRHERQERERFKRFAVADLLQRDKLNLDIFWLKDESLDDMDSLPAPNIIAAEIVENPQAALEAFQAVADKLAVKP